MKRKHSSPTGPVPSEVTQRGPYLADYNDQQYAAITSMAESIVLVAGPGSGKTKTLTGRIIHLIESVAIKPEAIIAITFTNNAAREMLKRLRDKLGHAVQLGYCGTLHGFMFKLCSQWPEKIGYPESIGIVDDEQSRKILRKIINDQAYSGSQTAVEQAIARGPLFKLERGSREIHPGAELVAKGYFRTLRESGLIDFDGMIHYGRHLLSLPEVKAWWPWTDLFVDEYQDSSDLFASCYAAMPVDRRFLVGDPDQAIYSFLGGDVNHILAAAQDAHTQTYRLESNYRCAERICAAAQSLIERNVRIDKKTVSATGEDGRIEVIVFNTPEIEVEKIATKIRELKVENSCAILVRSNAQATDLAAKLSVYGIPIVRKEYSEKPADWPLVTSLLALLTNPDNSMLAENFLRSFCPDRADAIIKQATDTYQSINDCYLNLKYDWTVAEAVDLLKQKGASAGAMAMIAAANISGEVPVQDLIFALGEKQGHSEESGSGVLITTYHSAKGREFDCVFLPAFEQGSIPLLSKSANLDEERRLAYVGFTRARKYLFISRAKSRVPRFGGFTPLAVEPSQFIFEANL
jgi:DNA helicase II / ATP-dependent DNA helicase PcrA